jgi:hypothetical protein
MIIWENAFSYKDSTVQDLLAHFRSVIDLTEIMNREEDWLTKVWAKQLYITDSNLHRQELSCNGKCSARKNSTTKK